jgi:hypothetical protein
MASSPPVLFESTRAWPFYRRILRAALVETRGLHEAVTYWGLWVANVVAPFAKAGGYRLAWWILPSLLLGLVFWKGFRAIHEQIHHRDDSIQRLKRNHGATYQALCEACKRADMLSVGGHKEELDSPEKLADWYARIKRLGDFLRDETIPRLLPSEVRLVHVVEYDTEVPWAHEADKEHRVEYRKLQALRRVLRALAEKYEPAAPWVTK